MGAPERWAAALRPRTRAFYLESISNPWVEVPPLQAVLELCRERRLISLVDNTLLSPASFRPLSVGFDLVIHSASKYLGGHNDLLAGVVAGSREKLADIQTARGIRPVTTMRTKVTATRAFVRMVK